MVDPFPISKKFTKIDCALIAKFCLTIDFMKCLFTLAPLDLRFIC